MTLGNIATAQALGVIPMAAKVVFAYPSDALRLRRVFCALGLAIAVRRRRRNAARGCRGCGRVSNALQSARTAVATCLCWSLSAG